MDKRLIRILASAGGGKTFRLSKRYIELLKQKSENLKRTLAITFTNRAAGEMKERILNILEESFHKGDKYAGKLVDYILDNYSDFSVRTIDSFINTLIRVFSIDLGFAPDTELILDADFYKEYAISLLIDRVEENSFLKKIISNYLLSKIEVEDKIRWDYKNLILDGLKRIENYEKQGDITFEIPSGANIEDDKEIYQLREGMLSVVDDMLKIVHSQNGVKIGFIKKLENFILNKNVDSFIGSTYLFKDCKGVMNKNSDVDERAFCPLFGRLKERLAEYYVWRIFKNFNHYINIYNAYKNILDSIKKKERVRFIDDINIELKSLFDNFTVPFVFYRIGERFYHYLIDEFQDTSLSQWENLYPLLENSLSEGGTFFFVGDPKQAIYQWRGGRVELFDRAFNSFSVVESEQKEENIIKSNYRSGYRIINFVKDIFSSIPNSILESMSDTSVYYRDDYVSQEYTRDFSGYVSVKRIRTEEAKKNEIEEEIKNQLVSTIGEILNYFTYSDISILVRTNKQARKIVKWLTDIGMPVISNESLYISGDKNIQGIISFLKFLQHPLDNASFYGLITSLFFLKSTELSFERIKEWAEHYGAEKIIMYERFRKDFPEEWNKFIEPFFVNVGFLPVYDLVSEVIRAFEISDNFPDSQPFLEGLLEFIHNLETKSITSIELMIDEWERIKSSPPSILLPENTDAIRVMTVHSAKGLEFPVVILPFVYFGMDRSSGVRKEVILDFNGKKKIAQLLTSRGEIIIPDNFTPDLKMEIQNALKKKKSEELFQEVNNLYVALTRSIYELHIFLPEHIPSNNEKVWWEILNSAVDGKSTESGERMQGKAERGISTLTLEINAENRESMNKLNKRLLLKRFDITSFIDTKSEEAIKIGNIVHKALYNIESLDDTNSIEKAINYAVNEEVGIKEREKYRIRAMELIGSLTNIDEVKRWFSPSYTVWKEKEIVDGDGNLHRPDRVIIKEDEVVLIDYKTGKEPISRYKTQINTYRRILEDYFINKDVSAYIVQIDAGKVVKIE